MDRRTWKEPVDQRIVAEGVYLAHRDLLRAERADQLLIAVHAGALWITQDGISGDVVIQAGEWHRLQGDGVVIANALSPASLTISAPLGASRRWEIERIAAHGPRTRVSGRKSGHRLMRGLTAAWLRLYRAGTSAARRATASMQRAQAVEDIARLAAQLDRRTRKDIGLEGYVPAYAERAERFRWLHDMHGAPRNSSFL